MPKFMGLDQYVWFQGVVEDRKDPLKLGRCRVRCLGFHSENKSEVPTDMLPWAYPLQPLTSAAMSGVGTSPVGPVEGTWVIGFFRDGVSAQEPVMMGTLAGKPEVKADPGKGFNDPSGKYPLEDQLNEVDTSRLARNENIEKTIIQLKVDGLLKGTQTANCGDWDEPKTPYASEYPYNHVRESESGHIEEWDDTPGAERLHRYHKAGTFEEIHPDGTKVTKNVKDNYNLTKGNDFNRVEGNANITVDGDAKIFVKSNVDLTCDGDMFANIGGDCRQQVDGSMRVSVAGTYVLSAGAGMTLNAPRIDMNPEGGVQPLNGACAADTGGAKENKTRARRSDEFESNDPNNAIPDYLLDSVQQYINSDLGGGAGAAGGVAGGIAAGGTIQSIEGPAGPQGAQGIPGVPGTTGTGGGGVTDTGAGIWDGYDNVGERIYPEAGTPMVVNFAEAINTDTVTFDWYATNDELTFNYAGKYLVMYRVGSKLTAGSKKVIIRSWLEKYQGNWAEIPGTEGYHTCHGDSTVGEGTTTVHAILDVVVPTSKIRVMTQINKVQDDGTVTVKTLQNGSGLSVYDLTKALTGVTGGGGGSSCEEQPAGGLTFRYRYNSGYANLTGWTCMHGPTGQRNAEQLHLHQYDFLEPFCGDVYCASGTDIGPFYTNTLNAFGDNDLSTPYAMVKMFLPCEPEKFVILSVSGYVADNFPDSNGQYSFHVSETARTHDFVSGERVDVTWSFIPSCVCSGNAGCTTGQCCVEHPGDCTTCEYNVCQGDCNGTWTLGGTCAGDNPCNVPTGQCCFGCGQCAYNIKECDCDSAMGTWTVDNGSNRCAGPDGNKCSLPTGRCCHPNDVCFDNVLECNCIGGDYEWDGGETCASSPCSLPTGKCCTVGTCSQPICNDNITQLQCTMSMGGVWTAGEVCVGSACNSCPCVTITCCHDDGECASKHIDPNEDCLTACECHYPDDASVRCGDGACDSLPSPCSDLGGVGACCCEGHCLPNQSFAECGDYCDTQAIWYKGYTCNDTPDCCCCDYDGHGCNQTNCKVSEEYCSACVSDCGGAGVVIAQFAFGNPTDNSMWSSIETQKSGVSAGGYDFDSQFTQDYSFQTRAATGKGAPSALVSGDSFDPGVDPAIVWIYDKTCDWSCQGCSGYTGPSGCTGPTGCTGICHCPPCERWGNLWLGHLADVYFAGIPEDGAVLEFDTSKYSTGYASARKTHGAWVHTKDLHVTSVGIGATGPDPFTVSGNANFLDNEVSRPKLKDYSETVYDNGDKMSVSLNWENGNVQEVTGSTNGIQSSRAVSFSNEPTAGSAGTMTVIFKSGGLLSGGTGFWDTAVKWPGGIEPALGVTGTDILSFLTTDGGTTIYGFVGGINFT
jgi:hypothetical protein